MKIVAADPADAHAMEMIREGFRRFDTEVLDRRQEYHDDELEDG